MFEIGKWSLLIIFLHHEFIFLILIVISCHSACISPSYLISFACSIGGARMFNVCFFILCFVICRIMENVLLSCICLQSLLQFKNVFFQMCAGFSLQFKRVGIEVYYFWITAVVLSSYLGIL